MITRVKMTRCQFESCRNSFQEGYLIEDSETGKEICVCWDCFKKLQRKVYKKDFSSLTAKQEDDLLEAARELKKEEDGYLK